MRTLCGTILAAFAAAAAVAANGADLRHDGWIDAARADEIKAAVMDAIERE